MKVIIWIYENDLEKLIKGKEVEYFDREPGVFETVIQISVGTDTYQKLKDKKTVNDTN
tara:strand:+ start:411 stop:584 length:174 start_codon:yes stop_codon:yes gene_type:complete